MRDGIPILHLPHGIPGCCTKNQDVQSPIFVFSMLSQQPEGVNRKGIVGRLSDICTIDIYNYRVHRYLVHFYFEMEEERYFWKRIKFY